MVGVIALSVLFNIPRYFDDHVVAKPDGSLAVVPALLGNDATFQLVYAGVIYYIVIYALPILVLAIMTYRLIISLRQFYKRREHVTKRARVENDMTKTLVAVVLMFMTCQLLNPVRRILLAIMPSGSQGCGYFSFYFGPLTSLAQAIDAASHFFVYSVCNKQFTQKLKRRWRRLASRSNVAPNESLLDDVASRAKTDPPMLARDIGQDVEPSSPANANTVA